MGINNRNLKTLAIDLSTSEILSKNIPSKHITVCESGIKNRADITRMVSAGISTFLIGENLLKQSDVGAATKALFV